MQSPSPRAPVRGRPRPGAGPTSQPKVPVVEPAPRTSHRVRVVPQPSQAPLPQRATPNPSSLFAASQPAQAPLPRRATPNPRSLFAAAQQSSLVPVARPGSAFVAERSGPASEIQPFKTSFFESIREVRARVVAANTEARALTRASLAQIRGYDTEDLFAIAEVAYHYLMNGGLRVALVLYEGLTAISPDEPQFALGLGLAHDHFGNREEALAWYRRAGKLDPGEPRADLNQAELYLEVRDLAHARPLLARAADKAHTRRDDALENKARALLKHLDRLN